MNQEEKELLFQDLSGRLPYHPMVSITENSIDNVGTQERLTASLLASIEEEDSWEHIKPCLRPIASMTGPEILELVWVYLQKYGDNTCYIKNFKTISNVEYNQAKNIWSVAVHYDDSFGQACTHYANVGDVNSDTTIEEIRWLNSHHFDYRGLIPKGFAVEVTVYDQMYEILYKYITE